MVESMMTVLEPVAPPARLTSFASYDVFGAKLTPTTIGDLLLLLGSHIDGSTQCVVASQNMHGLRVRLKDPEFERLHALPQTYVHIDGMPLVWLCRLRGFSATRSHRVTLVDLIWPLLEAACARAWRVYYVGATENVLAAASAAMRARLPELVIRAHHGYFDPYDAVANAAVTDDIRRFQPDLILVGMGMGRQERWILDNLETLAPASFCTVGACMEYVAGAVRTPPRWMGRTGLEWLFRLGEDPRRFWRRYLVEPWVVLAHVTRKFIST